MTNFTHEELQELLGAYALDAVDGEERDAVELHLRECPRCRAEVAEHREVASLIGHGGAPAPEGVWDRIVEAIEPTPPPMRLELTRPPEGEDPSVVVPLAGRRGAPTGWNRRILAVAAAAVIVIAVLGVVATRLNTRVDKLSNQNATAQLENVATEALSAKGTRRAQLKSADGKISVPVALTSDGEGYLLASTTPAIASDRTYQLWGVVGKHTISLGTFPAGAKVVAFRVSPKVEALAVTEEDAGGVVSSKNAPVALASI